jgi:prefoldin alpha subunit
MNALEMQGSYIQAAINEYTKAKITLENLNKTKNETEMLLPVGGSTYINATAKDTSKVLFDIGAGIVTERKSEDVIKNIDKRIEELQKTQEKLLATMQQLQAEANDISIKAQKLMDEQQ